MVHKNSEYAKYSKRKGLKWLSMVSNPFKEGVKADRKCQDCGHWLYAEGDGHDCEESITRGR